MAKFYNVEVTETTADATTLKLGFGESAQNDAIVPDAISAIDSLGLEGGKIVKLNGPASLPVAIALGHAVAHKFAVVACFDPKLSKYVVSVSHDPAYKPGQLLD